MEGEKEGGNERGGCEHKNKEERNTEKEGRGRKEEKEGRAEGRREEDRKTFQHGFRALSKLSHSLTFLRIFNLKKEKDADGKLKKAIVMKNELTMFGTSG